MVLAAEADEISRPNVLDFEETGFAVLASDGPPDGRKDFGAVALEPFRRRLGKRVSVADATQPPDGWEERQDSHFQFGFLAWARIHDHASDVQLYSSALQRHL